MQTTLSTAHRHRSANKVLRKLIMGSQFNQLFFPLAPAENPTALAAEAKHTETLGTTRDGCRILLVEGQSGSLLLRETGRLRELAFRRVGEGTGLQRDLDQYDSHYQHLVLWDENMRRIAGAYRLGNGRRILTRQGQKGFYTHSLYHFSDALLPYLDCCMELGRSFIHPDYQGKASLDYLWQGIGAYLASNPHIRYLLGPVSISARIPSQLTHELISYLRSWYLRQPALTRARHPFFTDATINTAVSEKYASLNRQQSFDRLQQSFATRNARIPVLFRQYTSLFEDDGFYALDFSVDPAFGDCVDVLCMADLSRLKASKRKRYIPEPEFENVPSPLPAF